MKRIVLLFFAIFAISLTGSTKKCDANFHFVGQAYYNNQPINCLYEISINCEAKNYSKRYQTKCNNGALDYEFIEYDIPEGLYEINVYGSVLITSLGKLMRDEKTFTVYIAEGAGVNEEFVLHLK